MNTLFLLALTIFICSKANLSIISINSSQSLVEALQKNFWSAHNTTVVIDSSKRYTLPPGKFFNVRNISIKIISNRGLVNIYCDSQFGYIHSTAGISFFNSNVTIERISFKNCGANLTTLPFDLINTFNASSLLYYTNTHAAALLFIQCTVDMTEVVLNRSYGFAVVGINIENSLFQDLQCSHSISKTERDDRIIGTGMLLHFTDIPEHTKGNMTISIISAVFENNYDLLLHNICINYKFYGIHYNRHYSAPNAAGLTVLYTQRTYIAHVNINNGKFSDNIGEAVGAMLIVHFQTNAMNSSSTSISNSSFERNAKFMRRKCHGVALQFYMFGWVIHKALTRTLSPLSIENTIFNHHDDGVWRLKEYQTSGAVYVGILVRRTQLIFTFTNFQCNNNTVPTAGGTCLTAAVVKHFGEGTEVNITMKNTVICKNMKAAYFDNPKSMLQFQNIRNVTFDGLGNFENNFGSVIYAVESNVYLQGELSFRNNIGGNGGAIWIEGSCPLYFMNGLKASFIDNRAYLAGGAIYAHVNSFTQCALQIANCHQIRVSFLHNLAETAGNSIFATPLYACDVNHNFYFHWMSYYNRCFNFTEHRNKTEENHLLPLSTKPHSFSVYFNENIESLQKFAGEKLTLTISATDNDHNKVYALINVEVYSKSYTDTHQKLWLTQSGRNQVLEGMSNTSMTLSVHSNMIHQVDALLIFTVSQTFNKAYDIRILRCPLGFDLKDTSGSCECSELFDNLGGTECHIDYKKISRKSIISSWIGGTKNNSKIALSKNCPNVYCNSDPYYKYIKSNNDGMVLLSEDGETAPLCLQNRVGILCGQCSQGYSVVFGTSECKKCSNWWLFTILMYAFAGPILIYLLYSLRLTLTNGTLNGIIFYAQVANTGLLNLMTRMTLLYNNSELIKRSCLSLSVILSILNLNIGFPLCFYNGMDQVWKTGLSLIFPVYLLTIVVVIITVSRHSSWLSNHTSHSSVQVLVTVVHLSFSKLSLAFIDVFTSSTIQTSSGSYQVWYWDGSVEYMKYPHYVLVIVTIVIALLFIIPYITLLLLAKPLIQYSRLANFYLRPIYEAIHAPFKEGRELWFVGRLMLLIFIYIMYVVERNSIIFYLTISSLLTSFLIGQTLFRPFKHKLINILDCWLMFNITLVYVSMWDKAVVTTTLFGVVAVILAILTFGAIIFYHILLATNCLNKITGSINRAIFFIYGKMEPFIPQKIIRKKEVPLTNTDSYYHTFEGYREPLLGK